MYMYIFINININIGIETDTTYTCTSCEYSAINIFGRHIFITFIVKTNVADKVMQFYSCNPGDPACDAANTVPEDKLISCPGMCYVCIYINTIELKLINL